MVHVIVIFEVESKKRERKKSDFVFCFVGGEKQKQKQKIDKMLRILLISICYLSFALAGESTIPLGKIILEKGLQRYIK